MYEQVSRPHMEKKKNKAYIPEKTVIFFIFVRENTLVEVIKKSLHPLNSLGGFKIVLESISKTGSILAPFTSD